MAAHKAKILTIPEYYIWRKANGRVFLQGWAKGGARGQVKRWRMREEEIPAVNQIVGFARYMKEKLLKQSTDAAQRAIRQLSQERIRSVLHSSGDFL
jgi:hypothetical protein